MSFSTLTQPEKQMFWGNVLLVVCCAFYLSWWVLAFKPTGAIKGMKTGWLLLPALAAGVAAVLLTVRGISAAAVKTTLFPQNVILWGGVAAYIVLLAVTVWLQKRPMTTELLLIVGWAVLALSEANALYGCGLFTHASAVAFVTAIGAVLLLCLICYVAYYQLDAVAGYLAGMAPLLLAALVMAGLSVRTVW